MQADSNFDLPDPDDDSRLHSERVAAHIRESIDASGGSVSFAEFMQLALYAPGLGYYAAGNRKFGEAGDFITAPEVSPLFSRVLARQAASVLEQIDEPSILEIGAGSGALAVAMFRRLCDLEVLPVRYSSLEVSADLQQRQKELIAECLPEHTDKFTWLDRLPEHFAGVIVANEVADALPVERFVRVTDGVQQLRVSSGDMAFSLLAVEAPDRLRDSVAAIEQYIDRRLADGYLSEVSPGLGPWIADICNSLRQGCVFLFDYGVSRREYYAAERSSGWLRCHYRHRVHDNALLLPGIQDLTAWVDFTACAEAASEAGAQVAGYVTQARFLMDGGIEEELAQLASDDGKNQLELLRQIKLLTLPGEMGENFKCLGLTKGDIELPPGFAFGDRAHVL